MIIIIQDFTGSQHFVLENLVDEVLHRQPEALQRFMLAVLFIQAYTERVTIL